MSPKRIFLSIIIGIAAITSQAKTIAVSYFDNTSNDVRYQALSKGIADMLITDLWRVKGITIVERERLEALLAEIKLGETKYINPQTAQQLGKGLGADAVLTGAFMVLGNQLRIDARLVDVESSEILVAEQVTGSVSNFFEVHRGLVLLLSESLKLSKEQINQADIRYQPVSLSAVVQYSNAIDYSDQGLDTEAANSLEYALKENPGFLQASDKLGIVRQNLIIIDKQREALLNQQIESILANIDVTVPNYGTTVNNSWSALIASFSYQALLEFNKRLIQKGVDRNALLFGETIPLTLGEMMDMYTILAYTMLKEHRQVIDRSQVFMQEYPTSNYFISIRSYLNMSLSELEERERGAQQIEMALAQNRMLQHVEYLDRFKWDTKFLSKADKDQFSDIIASQVIAYFNSYQQYFDDFEADDLEDLFEICLELKMPDQAEELISLANELNQSIENDELIFEMKESLDKFYEEEDDKRATQESFQAEYSASNPNELYSFVTKAYAMLRCEAYALVEDISLRYLSANDQRSFQQVAITKAKAMDNLFSVYEETGEVGKYEKLLDDFEKQGQKLFDNSTEFEEIKKEYQKTLRSLKSAQRFYIERVLNYPLQQKIVASEADICRDNKQYLLEIKLRNQLLRQFELSPQEIVLQRYGIFNSSTALGHFDEARKQAGYIIQLDTEGIYSQAVNATLGVLPR